VRIAITGASGLLGSALIPALTADGWETIRLVRARPKGGEVYWDPATGEIDAASLEGIEAVIHLAGASIAERWTEEHKRRVLQSRQSGTSLIAETCAGLTRPPRTLVSASAVGIYGDRGSQALTEADPPGSGFAAEVGKVWEAAAEPARMAGIRVVNLRFGIVLSANGGALGKMLPPFRLGLGGRMGSGAQWMSWIAIDDVVGVVRHALATATMAGPVNATAPNPVTNQEFTRTLGRVLGRPTPLPVPAFALRLLFGEMADELLLGGAKVIPEKLLQSGYGFRYPNLEEALRAVL
jgi:uncharacterized protein (TIGR01777 family)